MQLPHPVYRLSLCPHGQGVLFGCGKEFVRWEPNAATKRTMIPSVDRVEGGVCLPDGRSVLAMVDGTVRVWASNPDHEVHVFPGDGGKVLSVALAPDGQHVASGGLDKTAHLWRLP
jgi:WD40 repeat protein